MPPPRGMHWLGELRAVLHAGHQQVEGGLGVRLDVLQLGKVSEGLDVVPVLDL
jgi:hypothetical protein